MASMWKKAMTYLGLGDEEDYADYDEYEEAPREQPRAASRPGPREPDLRSRHPDPEAAAPIPPMGPTPTGTVRALPPEPRIEPTRGVGSVAPRTRPGSAAAAPPPMPQTPNRGAVVRPLPVPVSAKPHVVVPASFNDVQEVADMFKQKAPVIVNLQDADRDLSRRIIDFTSGLCYGLGGGMERVANAVYLVTPADVEVSDDEKRRLHERGYSS